MKMVQIKCLVVLLVLITCTHQTDYCARTLCGGLHHIACHNSGICQQPSLVVMTPQLMNIILSQHNHFRNLIASGRERHFQPAAKMPLLKWNNELSHFAKLNVLQCRMKHDECRNTNIYKFCGQNLGIQKSWHRLNVQSTVNNLITTWYHEHNKASMSDINNFRFNKYQIGHFTSMIQEKASEVGCAIATYKSNGLNIVLLACDYNFMNVVGVPVYTSGQSCSLCRTGCNKFYPALCNKNERVISTP